MGVDQPIFRSRPVESTEGAMSEYRARQEAERVKMAKLREIRLASEAQAGVKRKGAAGEIWMPASTASSSSVHRPSFGRG